MYEELVFVNELKSGAATPWLASKYAWSNHDKTLTFTIRPGVKWSDGKPLTAADVLFTFKLIKKYKALDLQAVWSVLKSVTRSGSKVTFKFKTAAVPYFYYVAGQTPIVPQHIWKSRSRIRSRYKDTNPVGSGPFTVSSLHAAGDEVHEERALLAEGPAEDRHGLLPGLHLQPTRRTRTSPAARPSGAASSSRASRPSTSRRARTTTTGSRRSRTSRSSSTSRTRSSRTSPSAARWPTRSTGRASPRSASTATSLPANQTGIVTPTFKSWLNKKLAKKISLQPDEGEADPHEGRLQAEERRLLDEVRQAALVHDGQHRRLLRLGRLRAASSSRS